RAVSGQISSSGSLCARRLVAFDRQNAYTHGGSSVAGDGPIYHRGGGGAEVRVAVVAAKRGLAGKNGGPVQKTRGGYGRCRAGDGAFAAAPETAAGDFFRHGP